LLKNSDFIAWLMRWHTLKRRQAALAWRRRATPRVSPRRSQHPPRGPQPVWVSPAAPNCCLGAARAPPTGSVNNERPEPCPRLRPLDAGSNAGARRVMALVARKLMRLTRGAPLARRRQNALDVWPWSPPPTATSSRRSGGSRSGSSKQSSRRTRGAAGIREGIGRRLRVCPNRPVRRGRAIFRQA
jgi:hypothetical protein